MQILSPLMKADFFGNGVLYVPLNRLAKPSQESIGCKPFRVLVITNSPVHHHFISHRYFTSFTSVQNGEITANKINSVILTFTKRCC